MRVKGRSKLLLAAALVMVAIAAGATALLSRASERSLQAGGEDAVRRAAAAYAELEQREIESLSSQLDPLLADPGLLAAYQARDRARLLDLARPTFEQLGRRGVTHWYFLDPEPARTCFLRVHAPELHGDVVNRETFSQAIVSHAVGAGKELGRTAFALRVVRPFRDGQRIVGYQELGEEIDHFLERMKGQTGDDFGLLVEKGRIDRAELARVRSEDRWEEHPELVLVDSTMWDERIISFEAPVARVPETGLMVGTWSDGNRLFAGGAFPVRDASRRPVGVLFVRHDVTALRAAIDTARRRFVALAIVAGVSLLATALVLASLRRLRPDA